MSLYQTSGCQGYRVQMTKNNKSWMSMFQQRIAPQSELRRENTSCYANECPSSRLGTEIILTKEMDGLVVAVPEAPPFETYQYDHEYEVEDDEEDEQNLYAQQR